MKQEEFRRTLRRDLDDLYSFYLDADARKKLEEMGQLRRWFHQVMWVVRSLLSRLAPVRRVGLLVAFVFQIVDSTSFRIGDATIEINFLPLSFLLIVLVLMLELKDKLLARDELEVGRAVQVALLPDRSPDLSGWEFWLFTRPANDVGGDLVDYLPLADSRLGLALGDVAGKGLGAALLMSKLQATLRALATEPGSLSRLGAEMNRIFCRDSLPGRFATLIYLELEPDSGRVKVLNAGHMAPIHLKHSGPPEVLPPVALPLGVLPDAEFQEQTVNVAPGETLVAYSDGLTEALNVSGEFFGDDRLMNLFPGFRGASAEGLGKGLVAAVDAFAGEERPSDDLSLVVLRRRPGAE